MPINIRNIAHDAEGINPFLDQTDSIVANEAVQILERNTSFDSRPDRLPFAEILLLEPEIGRIVFDTTNEIQRFWNGVVWLNLSGSGTSVGQRAAVYSALTAGTNVGDLAYVNQGEGTQWLPGTLGGTYYPYGWYIWDGISWISDRNNIVNQLQLNVEGLGGKANVIHTHIKSDITDFNDNDYATFAQGTLADLALQVGDNNSSLINDAGYIVKANITGYITEFESDNLYNGYEVSGTPTIQRLNNNTYTYAQGVTNLTTDWTNKINLTYV